jgi:hypothetical protein
MELRLITSTVEVRPDNGREVEVIIDVEGGDVLDHFRLKDIVEHFGADELLDQIGMTEAIEHFDLQEKE